MAPGAQASGSDNAAFLSHLNSLRAAHGLRSLAVASDLASIASQHSAAMEAKQTIFHNASLTSEVQNWQVLGENVGMGGTVAAIDTAFDNSPEHYANEVNASYTQVGIGTARDSRGYLYVTLDFRKPESSAPAPRPPAPKPVVKAPAVHAPAVPAPVVRPPAARPPSSTPQTVARQATTPTESAPVTARAVTPAAPQSNASATAAAVATAAARQAPTIVPVTATGNDPVASALAFSNLLAGMR